MEMAMIISAHLSKELKSKLKKLQFQQNPCQVSFTCHIVYFNPNQKGNKYTYSTGQHNLLQNYNFIIFGTLPMQDSFFSYNR